jgi:predicted RecA/RadA family phage recombinase
MGEAIYLRDANDRRQVPAAAVATNEVWQLPDGKAGYLQGQAGNIAGDPGSFKTDGQVIVPKAASIVLLAGDKVYWDHSANVATFRPVNDRDFYLGTVVDDVPGTATEVVVNLNCYPVKTIDMMGDPVLSVATGTQAIGGFTTPLVLGSTKSLRLTATNEAQCVDVLSVDRRAVSSNPIVEAVVRIGANGSTNAVDFNIGIANGTSTTDADAVTEHVFFHIDGDSTAINAQSKDGTTTVAAVDTTTTFTAGSAVANRVYFTIDARDPASVKLYVNKIRVLPDTVFRLDNATGPLGILAHLEKTTGTATAGPFLIDELYMRCSEQ